jgi:hypothetical protein
MIQTRVCTRCHVEKDQVYYNDTKTAKRSYCKTCQNDYYRVWKKKDNLRWKATEEAHRLKMKERRAKEARLATLS